MKPNNSSSNNFSSNGNGNGTRNGNGNGNGKKASIATSSIITASSTATASAPETAPPETLSVQQPRGHRHRRTTLPRSTRGWSRGIVWSLIGLTSFGIVYGSIAQIDTSVNANGKLRPIGGVTEISPSINGRIKRVLVKEGQQVQAGQVLIQLENNALLHQQKDLQAMHKLWEKEAQILAKQLGLSSQVPKSSEVQRELAVKTRETSLREQSADQGRIRTEINLNQQIGDLATLRNKYSINESISRRMEGLVKQGAMAQLELDRQNERQLELLSTIRRTGQEINAARRKVSESNLNREQVTAADSKQLYPQYNNVRQQLIDGDSRLAEINERIRLSQVVAPITGRVFDLSVKPGETTNTARPILKLIPDHDLEAELAISNRDIGFLEPGMPVDVRVTSFPFTDYGSIKGTLLRVGADALPADPQNPQEYFPAKIRINRNVLERRGRSYNLRPGMAVTALIQLGSRPVISLISDRFGAFVESSRTIR